MHITYLFPQSQHSQYESVRELIRTVSQYSGPGFEKLCYLLERTGLGHVTDELQAEVSREKGETGVGRKGGQSEVSREKD